MFNLFKKKELPKGKTSLEIHNRITDIRLGRKYARGDSMGGNTYECLKNAGEEVYTRSMESSDDLKGVDKACFIEGYDLQKEELSRVVRLNSKD